MTLQEMLFPATIMDVISRIRAPRPLLASYFGFLPERFQLVSGQPRLLGARTAPMQARTTAYRIYNNSRDPAPVVAPGAGPATVAEQPVGQVFATAARIHPKVTIEYEKIDSLSRVVGPQSEVDPDGQDYITRQETTLAQKMYNTIELMAVGMTRGQIYYRELGDQWIPSLAAPTGAAYVTQNFQIPTGNKTQLNMTGAGNIVGTSWANPAAPIVQDCFEINAAFDNLNGGTLTDVFLSSVVWAYVITNTEVRNVGGSSATPFLSFEREPDAPDGQPANRFTARLKAMPHVRWHVSDEVVRCDNGSGTLATEKKFADTMATFIASPGPELAKLGVFPEVVVETPGGQGTRRDGFYFWSETRTQPSCVEILGVINCTPQLFVPSSVAPATVVF